MNPIYLPEPCLCGAYDCPRCYPQWEGGSSEGRDEMENQNRGEEE